MALTDDQKIISRIEAAKEAIESHASRDRANCLRYVDPSQEGSQSFGLYSEDPNLGVLDQAVGDVPYLQTNIHTKAAAVAFGNPDWYVDSQQPETAFIVKLYLQSLWTSRKWKRLTEKALIKRCVSGLGCLAYLWDEKTGPELEHVSLSDLFVDPFVTEWHDLRYAGRTITMPRDEALAKWPDKADELGPGLEEDEGAGADYKRTQGIELDVYWDQTTEAVRYGETLLSKTENLYGKVPLVFLLGDYDPRATTEFPQGDMDICGGIAEMRTRLTDVINNQAQHGGTLTLYNAAAFSTKGRQELEDGREQGLLECKDLEDAIKRVPAEDLSPTVMTAEGRMEAAMDAAQGVNQYMRGVVTQDPKFATQVGATSQMSGARGTQQRLEYEYFLNELATAVLSMTAKFAQATTPEEQILLQAVEAVTEVTAVEQSTSYKDPALETAAAAQDIQLLAPIAPMVGLNMQALVEDYLRARGKRDMSRYFAPPQQAAGVPAPQSAADGASSGGPVPMTGPPAQGPPPGMMGGPPPGMMGGGPPPGMGAAPVAMMAGARNGSGG